MAKNKYTVALAIIAKNEFASSKKIWPKIPLNAVDRIFLVDGQSTDGTVNFYKEKGIEIYVQKRKGLGAATAVARKNCKEDGIIFFHPDGNENPKDISKIANLLRNGEKFVIPSRMIKGGFNEEDNNFLKPRKWFNLGFAFVLNIIFNLGNPYVSEVVQGFRGIDMKTLKKLKATTEDRTIDCQQIVKAMKNNIRIYEFPTKEGKRIAGTTNFGSLKTGYLNIKTALRELFI